MYIKYHLGTNYLNNNWYKKIGTSPMPKKTIPKRKTNLIVKSVNYSQGSVYGTTKLNYKNILYLTTWYGTILSR